MRRKMTRILALAALMILAASMDVRSTKAHSQISSFGSTCVSYAPQSWGEYKVEATRRAWRFKTARERCAS
jgi:hypothetical protein